MPKKNQKKDQKDTKLQIVDEQKEPCLRALQKKIRNLNKKLTEIADLQHKNDLKPEQLEKIQRKQQHLQQKDKYLEFIAIYQTIIQQNADAIRNVHLNELREVATVLAAREYKTESKSAHQQELDALVNTLSSPSSKDLTLTNRISQITNSLEKVANNAALKKQYLKFAKQNPDATLPQQEQSNNHQQEQVEAEVSEPIPEPVVQEKIQVKPPKEEPSKKEQEKVNTEPQAVPAQTEVKDQGQKIQQTEEKIPQTKNQQREGGRKKREYRKRTADGEQREQGNEEGKPRRQYNRNKDRDQEGRPPKKNNKSFKPKYAPKEGEQKQRSDSESSSSSSEVREFKREERKKLEEDGFIVISKNKPKPKARQQKQWHDHQHGKKHHHHSSKQNY